MKFSKSVVSKLLDVYPAHAALVDSHGTILVVNRAWKAFGLRNGLADPQSCEKMNYLEECDRAHARGSKGAAAVRKGIGQVLSGAAESFGYSYECHSAAAHRWFHLIVAPFSPSRKTRWAVLLHVDTTHQRALANRYSRLSKRKTEMVSVCAWCSLVENGPDDWIRFEEYFSKEKGIRFTHGICSACMNAFVSKVQP